MPYSVSICKLNALLMLLCAHPDHSCVQVSSVTMACVVFGSCVISGVLVGTW